MTGVGVPVRLIFQKNWFSSVKHIQGKDLLAETTVVGTDIEANGRLVIDKSTFIIKDASWGVYRSPGGMLNGGGTAPGLKGVTAYFNVGGDLRRVVGDEAGGLARGILAECVRGIIQAETFIYSERGYASAEAYGDYWENNYANSCRYYSNLHRISRKWPEYVGGYCRGENFFNRAKSCSVFRKDGGLTAAGSLSDSFHEIGMTVDTGADGKVNGISCDYTRAPDQVCFECAAMAGRLKGVVLPGASKKLIASVIGGAQGCDHLVDLLYDLGKVVASAMKEV